MKSFLNADNSNKRQLIKTSHVRIRTHSFIMTHQNLQRAIKYYSKYSKVTLPLIYQENNNQGFMNNSQKNPRGIAKVLVKNSKASVSVAFKASRLPLNQYVPLSDLKFLQTMTALSLPIIANPSSHRIQLLSHILTTLKNLTRVSFQISAYIDEHVIHSLFRSFSRLPSLSHLALKFSSQSPSLQFLASYISKLAHLKGLTLHFLDSEKIAQDELAHLSPIFTNLSLLSEVDIKLSNSEGSKAETVVSFLGSLAKLKFLTKLHLSIVEDIYYRNPWRTNPLSLNLKKLNTASIRELYLEFDDAFTDSTFASLSFSLTKFSSLKTLGINFSKSIYVTEPSVSQFVSDLEQLTELSSLNVAFSHMYSNMMRGFSQNMACLTRLTDLTLNFTGCFREGADSVKLFSSGLQRLTRLKSLSLIFRSNKTIKDQTLELLMKGIEKLEALESFEIYLNGCLQPRNESIKAMASSLSHLQNLRDLKLSLLTSYPDNLSLKTVALILMPLHSLHSFELKFFDSFCIPERDEIDFFLDASKDLSNLREMNLFFEGWTPSQIEFGSLKHKKVITFLEIE